MLLYCNDNMTTNNEKNTTPNSPVQVPLGTIFVSPGIQAALELSEVVTALVRHAAGDWGEEGPQKAGENAAALANARPIFSSHSDSNGIRFWIITDADRSATAVLLAAIP